MHSCIDSSPELADVPCQLETSVEVEGDERPCETTRAPTRSKDVPLV